MFNVVTCSRQAIPKVESLCKSQFVSKVAFTGLTYVGKVGGGGGGGWMGRRVDG